MKIAGTYVIKGITRGDISEKEEVCKHQINTLQQITSLKGGHPRLSYFRC